MKQFCLWHTAGPHKGSAKPQGWLLHGVLCHLHQEWQAPHHNPTWPHWLGQAHNARFVHAAGPTQFQDPGCVGDPTLGKVGCAPTAASVYAWADYSALLASRWPGGAAGRFTHFIVWNEVWLGCLGPCTLQASATLPKPTACAARQHGLSYTCQLVWISKALQGKHLQGSRPLACPDGLCTAPPSCISSRALTACDRC